MEGFNHLVPENRRRENFFLLFFFLFSFLGPASGRAAQFIGNVPTGFFQLDDARYPVYLYVPENYKPDREYPLLISIPGDAESAEQNVREWAKLAKKKSIILMAPGLKPRENDVPYQADNWILGVKNEVAGRYRIAKDKTYLVGKEGGAHYAAYLGAKYPEEFSAVALLDGSWVGPFEELIRMQSRPRRQNPYYLAFEKAKPDLLEKTKARALRFEKKGYPVYMEKLGPGEDFSAVDFKKRLVGWLEEKGRDWNRVIRNSEKSVKEKVLMGLEDFVEVEKNDSR